MKITDVTSFPVFNGQRNNLFITVDTDEGISGVGESGLSGRELAVMGNHVLLSSDQRRATIGCALRKEPGWPLTASNERS